MPANEITVTIGSVTLNSSSTPGATCYVLQNTEEILDALQTRRSDTEKQGSHGVEPSISHYRPRELLFRGEIQATSQSQRVSMQQALDEALALPRLQSYDGDDGAKLVLITDEDGVAKQLYATVVQMPKYGIIDNTMPESRTFEFIMFAPEPEVYAQTATTEDGPESFATTTFTFQDGDLPTFKDGELPTFQDATGAIMEVENDGNYPTPVLIVLTGPLDNPVLTNTTTGKKLAFNRSGGVTLDNADEYITVNTADGTAVKTDDMGAETNVRGKLSLDSEFFDIHPGTNELTLFDDTADDLEGQAEVTFRDAWI